MEHGIYIVSTWEADCRRALCSTSSGNADLRTSHLSKTSVDIQSTKRSTYVELSAPWGGCWWNISTVLKFSGWSLYLPPWRATNSARRRYCPDSMHAGIAIVCSPRAAIWKYQYIRSDTRGDSGTKSVTAQSCASRKIVSKIIELSWGIILLATLRPASEILNYPDP